MLRCKTSLRWAWISICKCQIKWTSSTNKSIQIAFTRYKLCIKILTVNHLTCISSNLFRCILRVTPKCKIHRCLTLMLIRPDCKGSTNRIWWIHLEIRLVNITKDFKITMDNSFLIWFMFSKMQWIILTPWLNRIRWQIRCLIKEWWTNQEVCKLIWDRWIQIRMLWWVSMTQNELIVKKRLGVWT